MKILVLGAGVIGVSSAYYLAKAGHDVTVIEENSKTAQGCSLANGGQLSFAHVENWSSSLSLMSLVKRLILKQSNISISNLKDKNFISWLLSLLSNSCGKKSYKNSRNLYRISTLSRELFGKIIAEENIEFNFNNSGILHFFRTEKELSKAINHAKNLDLLDKEVIILNPNQCLEKEPTLQKLHQDNKLAGGLFYKNDACGDCAKFVENLTKICQKKYNVKFEFNTKVKNILTNYKKITGINTSKQVFTADHYVYALGFYGMNLLKGIKIDPKIYPAKGHSVSFQQDSSHNTPQIGLTDSKNKIVYSKIGDVFRSAGTIDLNNNKNIVDNNKISFLKKVTNDNFLSYGSIIEDSQWSGIRPFRANSLPVICNVKKYGNLSLNSGHGSLGWTLSLASGKIISDIIDSKLPDKFDFLEKEKIN